MLVPAGLLSQDTLPWDLDVLPLQLRRLTD